MSDIILCQSGSRRILSNSFRYSFFLYTCGTGNNTNMMTMVQEICENIFVASYGTSAKDQFKVHILCKFSIKLIDTATYHPASALKNPSSSMSSSKGVLVPALEEVGLLSPRSLTAGSVPHSTLVRVFWRVILSVVSLVRVRNSRSKESRKPN
jgi:hypothetical protein